ncbi:hypothetical protein AB0K12_48025 [Nonomuraea sp. NPDC049419]|uniref:alpha/beta hydrolase n=1 Tax=Nonomuraea sp. NPDC049419 TaxID=3155772 RepID=UPI0034492C45
MKTPRLPAVAAAACLALTTACAPMACATTSTAATTDLHLQLPRPTGADPVGRDILSLVDTSRKDPWVPASGPRRLMLSLHYPARSATGDPAPYMTKEEAASLIQRKAPGTGLTAEAISGTRTYARTGARPEPGRHPLVVLSPGLGLPRAGLTALAEDLASRGYVVASIDHAYESSGTTFPGAGLLTCAPLCEQPKPPEGGKAAITTNRACATASSSDNGALRHHRM